MYGVVVCSKCKKARGVSLDQKTTMCQCGNRITIKGTRIKARTEDARELAVAVAAENAELIGGREGTKLVSGSPRRISGIHGLIADEIKKNARKDEEVAAAAVHLSKHLGVFTEKDYVLVLTGMGIANPREHLKRLIQRNIVYEPVQGRFKAV